MLFGHGLTRYRRRGSHWDQTYGNVGTLSVPAANKFLAGTQIVRRCMTWVWSEAPTSLTKLISGNRQEIKRLRRLGLPWKLVEHGHYFKNAGGPSFECAAYLTDRTYPIIQLRNGATVKYCSSPGAGVSVPSGLPLFDGLAMQVYEKLGDPLFDILTKARKSGDRATMLAQSLLSPERRVEADLFFDKQFDRFFRRLKGEASPRPIRRDF